MATENIYGYKGDLIIPDPIKKLSSDNSNSQTNTETNTNIAKIMNFQSFVRLSNEFDIVY